MYVNYFVEGYMVGFQAGPYSVDEVDYQWFDINGYDRVSECYVTDIRDSRRILMSSNPVSLSDREAAEDDFTATR